MNIDVEMVVANMECAIGESELCRTWPTRRPSPPPLLRQGGDDIEGLSILNGGDLLHGVNLGPRRHGVRTLGGEGPEYATRTYQLSYSR